MQQELRKRLGCKKKHQDLLLKMAKHIAMWEMISCLRNNMYQESGTILKTRQGRWQQAG